MSVRTPFLSLAVAVLATGALLSPGAAQDATRPAAQSDQQSDQTRPGQQAQQGQSAQRPQARPGQPHRNARGDFARDGGHASLQSILVEKLTMANRAEIELSQLAQQQSTNEEVKSFAGKMIQEHQQLTERLQTLAGAPQARTLPADAQTRDAQTRDAQAGDAQGVGTQLRDSAAERLEAASNRLENASQRLSNASDRLNDETPDGARRSDADQRRMGRADPLPELRKIGKQAAENTLSMTKQLLQEHDGEAFDACYVGQQVVAHTCMLAELQALDGVGSAEFQQFVSQAKQATEGHLTHAKQLAKQVTQDDARATTATTRSASEQPAERRE